MYCKDCDDCRQAMGNNYPAVWFFGRPENKKVFIVGLNPSMSEFTKGFIRYQGLDEGQYEAHLREYFDRGHYAFFEDLMPIFKNDELAMKMGYSLHPWDRVGYLDIVKCPTRGGWESFKKNRDCFNKVLLNCRKYIDDQFKSYAPRILLLCGGDARKMWFEKSFKRSIKENTLRRIHQFCYYDYVFEHEGKTHYALAFRQLSQYPRYFNEEITFIRSWLVDKLDKII